METALMIAENLRQLRELAARGEAVLRHPADWVVRFHHLWLRREIPSGRVLDYGCGSANNACFFLEKGYDVWGMDAVGSYAPHIAANLARGGHAPPPGRFRVWSPEETRLPFSDASFDFILANQVLYYLPPVAHIRAVCDDLSRVLRPGGVVFFTMMGPRNYYLTHHVKQVHAGGVHEVVIDAPGHRLSGLRELIFVVRDETELADLFSAFEPLTIGYFEQRMFDFANFHWIFAGRKR